MKAKIKDRIHGHEFPIGHEVTIKPTGVINDGIPEYIATDSTGEYWFVTQYEVTILEGEDTTYDLTELHKYQMVNAASTLEELANVVERIGDENGVIMGRSFPINAIELAHKVRNYNPYYPNVLTRSYGIRQQAMMLHYYES